MKFKAIALLGMYGFVLTLSPSLAFADSENNDIIVEEKIPFFKYKPNSKIYKIGTSAEIYDINLNDVLVKIPNITIGNNGVIALQGKDKVNILINGKDIATDYELQNYPASRIYAIEVVNNPSTNYKNNASYGIVNIILKKPSSEGLNGIINMRGDADGRYDIDLTTSYRKDSIALNLLLGSDNSIKETKSNEIQLYNDANSSAIVNTAKNTRRQQYISLGTEYQISDKNNIMFKVGANDVHGANKEYNTTYIINNNDGVTNDYDYSNLNSFINRGQNLEVNFQHNDNDKNENFDLNFVANQSDTDEENAYNLNFLLPVASVAKYDFIVKTKDNNMKFNTNYHRSFADKKQISAGFEFGDTKSDIYQNTNNISAIRADVSDYNSTFKYKYDVGKLYINYQMPLGDWDIATGLSYEVNRIKTISMSSAKEQEYFRLLPSLDINRDINEKIRFVISYNHHTEMPSIWQLNPTIVYSSPINQFAGNQSLKIQDTDYVESGLVYRNENFDMGFSVFYRKNYEPITASYSNLNGGIQSFSYINAANSSQTGIDLNFGGQINNYLNYNVSLNGYDGQIMGVINGVIISRDYQSYTGNIVIDYEPSSKDWLQLIFDARGKNAILQGYETEFTKLDLTYRHKFNKKLTISMRAYDILNSSKQSTIINLTDFKSVTARNISRPAVSLGIAYKY